MASSLHFTNPSRKDWINIYQQMDEGKLQDQVIYKIGKDVFGARSKEEVPKNSEVLTKDRIVEILHSEKNEDPTLSISSDLFDPVKASQVNRAEYLELNHHKPWVKEFSEFELDLNELLLKKDESFEKGITDFVNKYREKYGVAASDFEALFVNRSDPYVREKMLNIVLNKFRNAQEIREFIETRKGEIISEFAPTSLINIAPEQFEFKVESLGKETHNLGKLPAKITFINAKKEAFTVIYKPRAATIDRKVLELLGLCNLPSYKIKSYENENKSIWYYVNGQEMIMSRPDLRVIKSKDSRFAYEYTTTTPEAFIRYSSSVEDRQRKSLLNQLVRLNTILLSICISDLHGENLKLGADNNIYPIDLEVMDERQATLMMIDDYIEKVGQIDKTRKEKFDGLPEDDKKQIVSWLGNIFNKNSGIMVPIRHVLVSTGKLAFFRFVVDLKKGADDVFNLIVKGLQNRGYEFTENQKKIIKNQVFIDLLNGDVPFFTELENVIYYGHMNKNYAIGQKKK